MTTCCTAPPRCLAPHRAGLAALCAVLLTGCASLNAVLSAPPSLSAAPADLQACAQWFAALDRATDSAGVRDAGAARVAGFAHYRLDRWTQSWAEQAASQGTPAQQAAVVQQLRRTDLQGRAVELANMGAAGRAQLAVAEGVVGGVVEGTLDAAHARTISCSAQLADYDTATPLRLASLWPRLQVPSDYSSAYRWAGGYALSGIAFGMGIRKLEAQRTAVMARDMPAAPGTQRLRYTPALASTTQLTPAQLRQALAPAPDDPLQVPAPSAAQLAALLAQFAPRFEIDTLTDDDKPGTLVWRSEPLNAASALGPAPAPAPAPAPTPTPTLTLDTAAPALYQQVATTRYQGRNLLQLVYTLWFAARPSAPGARFDLLAGKLDGIVWRVTLAPDGTPLVFDTIHPCGCYHQFFPTPAARVKPAPQRGIEWAFVPHSLPAITAQDRVVLRIAARTHYIDRVSIEPASIELAGSMLATPLAMLDYHRLRTLPVGTTAGTTTGNTRSVFSPTGFMDGTDRAERYIFWPTGIARAGTMRQWGKHATAFVGQRHFDDALLLEQRFEFDPLLFK
jgi:hypothetical protein